MYFALPNLETRLRAWIGTRWSDMFGEENRSANYRTVKNNGLTIFIRSCVRDHNFPVVSWSTLHTSLCRCKPP